MKSISEIINYFATHCITYQDNIYEFGINENANGEKTFTIKGESSNTLGTWDIIEVAEENFSNFYLRTANPKINNEDILINICFIPKSREKEVADFIVREIQ